jgi:hypothetical protein
MNWSDLDLVVYADAATEARGLVALPSDNVLRPLSLTRKGGAFALASDPLGGKVKWTGPPGGGLETVPIIHRGRRFRRESRPPRAVTARPPSRLPS